jgi:hypothetical protein
MNQLLSPTDDSDYNHWSIQCCRWPTYNVVTSTNAISNLSPFGPQTPITLTQIIQGTELLNYIIQHVSYTFMCLPSITMFTALWYQTTLAAVTSCSGCWVVTSHFRCHGYRVVMSHPSWYTWWFPCLPGCDFMMWRTRLMCRHILVIIRIVFNGFVVVCVIASLI